MSLGLWMMEPAYVLGTLAFGVALEIHLKPRVRSEVVVVVVVVVETQKTKHKTLKQKLDTGGQL